MVIIFSLFKIVCSNDNEDNDVDIIVLDGDSIVKCIEACQSRFM